MRRKPRLAPPFDHLANGDLPHLAPRLFEHHPDFFRTSDADRITHIGALFVEIQHHTRPWLNPADPKPRFLIWVENVARPRVESSISSLDLKIIQSNIGGIGDDQRVFPLMNYDVFRRQTAVEDLRYSHGPAVLALSDHLQSSFHVGSQPTVRPFVGIEKKRRVSVVDDGTILFG